MRYLVKNTLRENNEGKKTFGYLGQCIPNTIIDIRDLMQIKHGNLDRTSYMSVYNNIVNAVMNSVLTKPSFYFRTFIKWQSYGPYGSDTLQLDSMLSIDAIDGSDCIYQGAVRDDQHGILVLRKSSLKDEFFSSEFIYEEKDEFVIMEADGATLRLALRCLSGDFTDFAYIPLPYCLGVDAEDSRVSNYFGAYYSSRMAISCTILNAYLGFMMNDLGFECIGDTSIELVGQPISFVSVMKKRDHIGYAHTHALRYILMENTLLKFIVVRYTSDDFGKESK
jgi:hypothetical protein